MESLNLLESTDPNLLTLIIDTNTCAWQDHHKKYISNDLKLNFENLIKSLAFLLQSYLLTQRNNQLVVISADDNGHSEVIYPTTSQSIVPTPSVFQSYFIEKLLSKSSTTNSSSSKRSTFSSLSSAFSKALCIINKQTIKAPKLQSQIVVTQLSSDDASTYNQIMNSIFSAHKLNVLIDSLVLSSSDSTFLQVIKTLFNESNSSLMLSYGNGLFIASVINYEWIIFQAT